jgi:hypothetical protein
MPERDEIDKTSSTPEVAMTTEVTAGEPVARGTTVLTTLAGTQEKGQALTPQELVPQTEQQTSPECEQLVRHNAHPSNYPPSVDVRRSSTSEV